MGCPAQAEKVLEQRSARFLKDPDGEPLRLPRPRLPLRLLSSARRRGGGHRQCASSGLQGSLNLWTLKQEHEFHGFHTRLLLLTFFFNDLKM